MRTREQKDKQNARSRERYETEPEYRQKKIERSQAARDKDKQAGTRRRRITTPEQQQVINQRARDRYASEPEFRQASVEQRYKQVKRKVDLPPGANVKAVIRSAKENAKKKGLEFKITVADIYIPDYCPVFGIPLFYTAGKATDNSPSIDRIDSSKGYIPGNVQIISRRANHLKNNATFKEMITLGKWADHMLNGTDFQADIQHGWKEGGDVGVYWPDLPDDESFLFNRGRSKSEVIAEFMAYPLTERLILQENPVHPPHWTQLVKNEPH